MVGAGAHGDQGGAVVREFLEILAVTIAVLLVGLIGSVLSVGAYFLVGWPLSVAVFVFLRHQHRLAQRREMAVIELTDWLQEELERRATAAAPEEACGLIGRGKFGLGLYAAKNVAESPTDSFVIAPTDQAAILETMERRGEQLVGLYHSHPKGDAWPSERDRAFAAELPPLTWIIVSVATSPAGFWVGDPLDVPQRP
jgi:proteasome lid subunit RPN8/RPN11